MRPSRGKVMGRYRAALRAHLKTSRRESPGSARALGSQALAAGLQTLDLAKVHEQILVDQLAPPCAPNKRAALIKRAGVFFASAITPIEETHRTALEAAAHLKRSVEALSERTVDLAASNRELGLEIARRKTAEKALKTSEHHYTDLLKQSTRLQEELRRLSRQVLLAQEDERKKISRELHDVIAQTLTGINIRLATLKKDASLNAEGLERNIALTQHLVEKSVDIVHRFARELRPAVLDDLGLAPALQSFLRTFAARTGLRTRLKALADVEQLDISRRTVLFRVAQEALNNVARHAQATQVALSFHKMPDGIAMKIKDNGKSFDPERLLRGKSRKHLGLLGMRERLEMVGGRLVIESARGQGTTILARVPFPKPRISRELKRARQRNLEPISL